MTFATSNPETKNEYIENYKKEYVYSTGYYDSSNGEYRHPYIEFIRLGTKYPEGYYYSWHDFSIEFQQDLKENDGKMTNNGLPYGGTITNLKLDNIEDFTTIMKDIKKQTAKLEIYSNNKYHDIITALRASGYRKGIKDSEKHYILAIE
jgi:hypothetical protein